MNLKMSPLPVYHDRLRTDENSILYGRKRSIKHRLSCIGTGTLHVVVTTKPFDI